MNHDDIKELAFFYWRGELTPDEVEIVEEHLSRCSECQKYYEEAKSLETLLSEAPLLKAPPTLRVQIIKEVNKVKLRQRIFRRWIPVLVPVIAVLIILFMNFPRHGAQLTATTVTLDLLSPNDGEVILNKDFVVIAALYPSLPFEADVMIDSTKVSENVIKGKGYLVIKDLSLEEGYHTLLMKINVPKAKYSTTLERVFYIVGRGDTP